jgi:hypothetical protein
MAYNTQNHGVSGLCPSFGILNIRKWDNSETSSVSEEDGILESHCRENLKSHIALTGWTL